jgi:hypothetical protein
MDNERSMLQGAEVWVPKGEVMVPSSGAYGPHGDFQRLSARLAFRRGEGLPGAVWSTERALLWRELGIHFVRAELARAAGIDTALGLPVHRGRELIAVVVLLLSSRCSSPGCVELWDEDRDLSVLRHAGGHYSGCPELESFSHLIQFPAGTGLPGGTWAKGAPVVMPDVRHANTFIRAGLAAKYGLQLGVGLPVYRRQRTHQVLTLIAAEKQPFLKAVELWDMDPSGPQLELSERAPELQDPVGGAPSAALAAAVREHGLPQVLSGRALGMKRDEQDLESPLGIGVGLPIHGTERLQKVLCLMF